MARKKGATKAKTTGRKATSDAKQADKKDAKVKDDPGGELPPAMEITNSCDESKITSVSQQQQHTKPISTAVNPALDSSIKKQQQVSAQNSSLHHHHHHHHHLHQPPSSYVAANNNTPSSTSSDLKYLHKKFKRIASATLSSGDSGVGPESESRLVPVTSAEARSAQPVSVLVVDERQQHYGRLQLTSLDIGEQQEQQQQQHSNGASLNYTHHVSGSDTSFISSSSNTTNHIPSESENLKAYYPSVNNISAIDASCDSSATAERNQCTLLGGSALSLSSLPVSSVVVLDPTLQASAATSGACVGIHFGNHHHHHQYEQHQQFQVSSSSSGSVPPGRYVCPYCQMNCSKPSVLQKHIRRHTNERPFRCDPCGIAFKTKSNLYKHCRSRAHASKSQGEDIGIGIDEDGSDPDLDDKELSNSGSEIINRGSPMDDRVHSPQLLVEKPYKPKFHNAALYTKFDAKAATKFPASGGGVAAASSFQMNIPGTGGPIGNNATNLITSHSVSTTPVYLNGQDVDIEQRISKLISDNEAIVEVVEPPLQKKYHKITGITRGISVSSSSGVSSSQDNSSRLASALLHKRNSEEQQQQQMLLSPQTPITPQPYSTVAPSEQIVITAAAPTKPSTSSKAAAAINLSTQGQIPVVYTQNHHPTVQLMARRGSGSEILQVQYQQPLNLSKPVPNEQPPLELEHSRKRTSEVLYSREQSPSYSAMQYQQQPAIVVPQQQPIATVQAVLSPAPPPPPPATQSQQSQPVKVTDHPQNPERSIIKDLLLNSRGFGIVQNPENENAENLFTCKSCNVSFRDAEILKYHTICYCQGNSSSLNSPSSAPISPVGSPSSHYMRSKSASDRFNPTSLKTLARVSLNPPPRNPSTLSKLAKSQLKLPRGRPADILLPAKESSSSSTVSSVSSNGFPVMNPSSEQSQQNIPYIAKVVDVVQNPLPSPGPLLGNTRLVDYQSNKSDSMTMSHVPNENSAPPSVRKRSIVTTENSHPSEHHQQQHPQLVMRRAQHPSLQMFGGDVEVVNRSEEVLPHRYTSGGTVTYSPVVDNEMHHHETGLTGRTSMHSGGTFMQMPKANRSASPGPMNQVTPKLIVTITPTLTPSLPTQNFFAGQQPSSVVGTISGSASVQQQQTITHFPFPPINPITAYNPLTLPQVSPGQATQIMHGGKLIPFVQGIPGPNSMAMVAQSEQPIKSSPRIAATPSPIMQSISINTGSSVNYRHGPFVTDTERKAQVPSLLSVLDHWSGDSEDGVRNKTSSITFPSKPPAVTKNGLSREIWSPAKQEQAFVPKKSFNFTRIADNISPRKKENVELNVRKEEIRYFNFENLISKSEILIKSPAPTECKPEPMEALSKMPVESNQLPPPVVTKPKFLRPNSLPLKPGTFTPKRHHGITPTHNTMPLISPETPRPSKSCRELYFNGHAYTNIGLKSSTKPFYCTVNKTQPFYVQTQKQLSMYSNWQVHPENDPHPLGLKPIVVMSLYDSNQQRDHRYSIATKVHPLTMVNSSSSTHCVMSTVEARTSCSAYPAIPAVATTPPDAFKPQPLPPASAQSFIPIGFHHEKGGGASNDSMPPRSESTERTLSGGFESTEEYTYVRGRGRGKYVCNECGIRCKKPSMLKKHIRTHTDVRPYSCQHCSFHFKTKGNLTKHMKSKSHFKKCTELGLNPIPTSVDDDGDIDIEGDQQSISSERTSTIPGDSDTGSDSDGEDSDDSDESKSRLPEHEAAQSLLSLARTPPTGSQGATKCYPSPVLYQSAIQQQQQQQMDPGKLGYAMGPMSVTSGLIIQQQPLSQQPVEVGSSSSSAPSRRVITFGNTPKVEFNLLKHEQYYSDPNLNKKKRELNDDDGAMPIDLTKKSRESTMDHDLPYIHRYNYQLGNPASNVVPAQPSPQAYSPSRSQVIVRVSDVVTPITGAANLLTTLVSNTDKIPVTSNSLISSGKEFDDGNVYFQEYIKQRALQDSRMKQSQMKSVNNNQFESTVTLAHSGVSASQVAPTLVVEAAKPPSVVEMQPKIPVKLPVEKPYRIFNGKNEQYQRAIIEPPNRIEILPMATVEPTKSIPDTEVVSNEPPTIVQTSAPEANITRMETLADVASGSLKLDAVDAAEIRPRSDSIKASSETNKPVVSKEGKESAKSVASEYLKLTKSVTTTLRKREDSESGTASDQEPLVEAKVVVAPVVAPIVPPVVIVPTTTIPSTAELGGIVARTVIVGEDGFKTNPANEFTSLNLFTEDGGRPVCEVCHKKFHKISQLKIHMNIHYMERKFRCEPCGTSFRSQGLFQKHERSATHRNKVSVTTTFGIATDSNPRPFYCKDCDVGFRIHGHLAKHLRSKMHVLKLECLGKLPFGTYTEIERSGTNLTEIDTTDCENSLSSLKRLAIRLNVKDPANVLPGDALPSGNETDSCDDNQYENDNESNLEDDSPGSNGPNHCNKDDDDEIEDEPPSSASSAATIAVPQHHLHHPQRLHQPEQVNNNHLCMKRKPDDSSTSNDSSSEDAKRARFQATPEYGLAAMTTAKFTSSSSESVTH